MRLINVEEFLKRYKEANEIASISPVLRVRIDGIIEDMPTVDAVPRKEYERVCRERDAAVDDITTICAYVRDMTLVGDDGTQACEICKNVDDYPMKGKCRECYPGSENNFEWRGVQDDAK